MSERVRDILQKAGVEHQARVPAEIIEHPLRSRFLDRTAQAGKVLSSPAQPEKPRGLEVPEVVGPALAVVLHPYVSVAFLSLTVFILAGMISGYFTRQAILADIGATTCSAEMSLMWIEEDPNSNVPRLKDEVLTRCAKAQKLS